AAIRKAHRAAHAVSPTEDITIEQAMRGIRRSYGEPPQGKAPAVTDIVRAMVETLPATTKGARPRADSGRIRWCVSALGAGGPRCGGCPVCRRGPGDHPAPLQ